MDAKLVDSLCTITGIGQTKAEQLVHMGLHRVSDLRYKKYQAVLPESAILHLKYSPEPITYQVARKIQDKIKGIGVITGSFRREKPILNDIDVVVFAESVDKLVGLLKPVIYSQGPEKISGFLHVSKAHYARIDIFICTPETYAGTIMYTTGSKEFNIRTRAIAKNKGLLLNQHGIFHGEKQIPTAGERDIFKILGIDYVQPPERR